MGDTWVTDITHLLPSPGLPFSEIPAPAQRLSAYLGAMIGAASLARSGETIQTALRCRRRPNHRPCPGYIDLVRLDVPDHVRWQCSACDDNGFIHNWHGCIWDLSAKASPRAGGVEECILRLDDDEYQLLRSIPVLDSDCERVALRARRTASGVRITCGADDLENLIGFVAFEANHEKRRQRQARLDEVYGRLQEALEG